MPVYRGEFREVVQTGYVGLNDQGPTGKTQGFGRWLGSPAFPEDPSFPPIDFALFDCPSNLSEAATGRLREFRDQVGRLVLETNLPGPRSRKHRQCNPTSELFPVFPK